MVPEPFAGRGFSGLVKADFFLGEELQNNYSVIKKLNRMNTRHTFSILIWQVKYPLKNGKAPLSVRVSVNGERAEIRTNREIPPTLWDAKAQRVKGATEEAKSINAHLEAIKSSLRMHESRLIALGKTVSAEILKNEYLGLRPNRQSLCTAFEVHIKRIIEKMKAGHKAPATLDKYAYTFDKIKAFLKHQYKVSDLYLEDIKRSFIHDLEHYLFTVEHLQNNTVMKYLRQTKTVLKWPWRWAGSPPIQPLVTGCHSKKKTRRDWRWKS